MSLTAQNISKSYSGKTILKNFKATFTPGIHFIFAPNGSGKTTLLNILGGADRSYEGKLFLDDLDATAKPELANEKRSYLSGDIRFYPGVSSYEFLSFIAEVRGLNREAILRVAQKQFGMTEVLLQQATESLSLGQKKRLFLAATLLPELSCWVLDEPTNGLDQTYREALLRELKRGADNGKTIIVASHDLAFAHELEVTPGQFDFCERLPK